MLWQHPAATESGHRSQQCLPRTQWHYYSRLPTTAQNACVTSIGAPPKIPNVEVVVRTASATCICQTACPCISGRVRGCNKEFSKQLPKLPQRPAAYCPKCVLEYRAGTNNEPKRRSRRTDGLCNLHAPNDTRLHIRPRVRMKNKEAPKKLPKNEFRCSQTERRAHNHHGLLALE